MLFLKKTNAMRLLDADNINYEIKEYSKDNGISGVDVAKTLNEDPELVFKTLVTQSKDENYVFVIPVAEELDLKKAAKVSSEKKIEMLAQKDLLKKTGYIHGGCSPIGMKKLFKTFIDESAQNREYIYVSGGKIGMQVKINPLDLVNLINGSFEDLTKGE